MEPLSEYIHKTRDVTEIRLPDIMPDGIEFFHEVKLCQFTDDTSIVLANIEDIVNCIKIIENFGRASGAKMNKKKTVCLVFKEISLQRECLTGYKSTLGPEIVLGVPQGLKWDMETFWSNKVTKMKTNLNIWRRRGLSIVGRVYITQILGYSNIYYAIENRTPENKILKNIERVGRSFVWKNKKSRVSKEIFKQPISEGGLGLTDLSIYANSRRIKFVLDVISGETECWKVLPRWYFKTLDKAYDLEYFVLRNDSDKQHKKIKEHTSVL